MMNFADGVSFHSLLLARKVDILIIIYLFKNATKQQKKPKLIIDKIQQKMHKFEMRKKRGEVSSIVYVSTQLHTSFTISYF
jgi:hypothetical protein